MLLLLLLLLAFDGVYVLVVTWVQEDWVRMHSIWTARVELLVTLTIWFLEIVTCIRIQPAMYYSYFEILYQLLSHAVSVVSERIKTLLFLYYQPVFPMDPFFDSDVTIGNNRPISCMLWEWRCFRSDIFHFSWVFISLCFNQVISRFVLCLEIVSFLFIYLSNL